MTILHRALPTLVALTLLASFASAQLSTTKAGRSPVNLSGSGTVTQILDEETIAAVIPGVSIMRIERVAANPDGDLILFLIVFPFPATLAHWDMETQTLTPILDVDDLGTVVGMASGFDARVYALDVAPNGDIYLLASDSPGANPNPTKHVVQVPLVGAAPGGYGAPVSLTSFESVWTWSDSNMRVNGAGEIEMIIDEGTVAGDAAPLGLGSGLFRWIPGVSTVNLPLFSFWDFGNRQTDGGPSLTADANADDFGISNMAAAGNRLFFTCAATHDTFKEPNFDTTFGESYDGDILTLDLTTGQLEMLISRPDYLAKTDPLGYDFGDQDPTRDIESIVLAVDEARDRLYTFEHTSTPSVASHKHGVLAQWNASTGRFEGVVATMFDFLEFWEADGEEAVGATFPGGEVHGPFCREGGIDVLPDGSIVLRMWVATLGQSRVLRVVPGDL